MIDPERLQGLQLQGGGGEFAVEGFERGVKRGGRAVGVGDAPGVAGAAIDVIGEPLRPVGEGRIDQETHLVRFGRAHGRRPRGGLNDIQERQAGVLRRAPDQP